MAIAKGQTYGKKKVNAWSATLYYKPTLRHLVIRHPGVLRRSEKVLARNREVAELKPASYCKGKPWREFVKCLSEVMRTKKPIALRKAVEIV